MTTYAHLEHADKQIRIVFGGIDLDNLLACSIGQHCLDFDATPPEFSGIIENIEGANRADDIGNGLIAHRSHLSKNETRCKKDHFIVSEQHSHGVWTEPNDKRYGGEDYFSANNGGDPSSTGDVFLASKLSHVASLVTGNNSSKW